jgi:putative transposase
VSSFLARGEHGLSLRIACQVLNISRSEYHYRPNTDKDIPVIEAIQEVVADYPACGFSKVLKTLRRRGHR